MPNHLLGKTVVGTDVAQAISGRPPNFRHRLQTEAGRLAQNYGSDDKSVYVRSFSKRGESGRSEIRARVCGLWSRLFFAFLRRIVDRFRLHDRWGIENNEKATEHILREALREIVPTEVLQVPKIAQRMRYDVDFANKLDEICDEILVEDALRARGWFRPRDIDRLRRRRLDQAYRPEQAMRLWTVILTEVWAQTFVDRAGSHRVANA